MGQSCCGCCVYCCSCTCCVPTPQEPDYSNLENWASVFGEKESPGSSFVPKYIYTNNQKEASGTFFFYYIHQKDFVLSKNETKLFLFYLFEKKHKNLSFMQIVSNYFGKHWLLWLFFYVGEGWMQIKIQQKLIYFMFIQLLTLEWVVAHRWMHLLNTVTVFFKWAYSNWHQRKSFPITPPPPSEIFAKIEGGGWLGGNSKFPIEKKRSHIEAPLKIFFTSQKIKGGGGWLETISSDIEKPVLQKIQTF